LFEQGLIGIKKSRLPSQVFSWIPTVNVLWDAISFVGRGEVLNLGR